MKYNLIICTSSNYWAAIDINEYGEYDRISFDGNEQVIVDSDDKVNFFCSQILDYYNIETFNDISIDIKIVMVGAYREEIRQLFDIVKNSNNVNIIDIRSVLPIYVLKKCVVKPGGTIDVECMDELFTLSIDDKFIVSYELEKSGKQITMLVEDFSFLVRFDCSNLISDEKEKKELEEKYEKELYSCKKDNELQKKAYDDLIAKFNKLELENQELKTELEKTKENIISKRNILRFDVSVMSSTVQTKEDAFATLFAGIGYHKTSALIADLKEKYHYKCVFLKKDGDIVSPNTNVAQIVEYNSNDEETGKIRNIKAKNEGRIYFLIKNYQNITKVTDIAIVADKADAKDAIMKWYKDMQ